MNNNPISNSDPEGDLFFVMPHISFSGGFSLGVTVGVGLPFGLNASATGGYNFGSDKAFGSVSDSIVSIIDSQIAKIDELIDKKDEQISELEDQIRDEESRQEDGYANRVALLEENLLKEQEERNKALEERQKKEKEAIILQTLNDTIQQSSSLITAGANIFESFSSIPFVGVPLAIAAIGTMIGAFAKLKIDAIAAAGVSLYKGTRGEPISDFAGQPVPHGKSDKPGSGSRGYGLYDMDTGQYVGVHLRKRIISH